MKQLMPFFYLVAVLLSSPAVFADMAPSRDLDPSQMGFQDTPLSEPASPDESPKMLIVAGLCISVSLLLVVVISRRARSQRLNSQTNPATPDQARRS